MSRKTRNVKRTIHEIDSDSDDVQDSGPTRKKLKQKQNKKTDEEKSEKSENNPFNLEITEHESIASITPQKNEIKGTTKIAAFDMDWTLIRPKSTAKFPKNRSDWKWMYNHVSPKLTQLYDSGYSIVIFSNQNGIGAGKQTLDSVTGKIIDLSKELDIPLICFLSTKKDHWRKPNTLMWDYFISKYNNGVKADISSSFYCGDAAGRPKGWKNSKTAKDFSCSDRKFAYNVGVKFYTPECYFLGEKENTTWTWQSLNAKEWIEKKENDPDRIDNEKLWFHGKLPIAKSDGGKLDMVLMRGPPGCGKSTFAKDYLVCKGYEWINRDSLKTQKKCLDAVKKALKDGVNVVIDNTNPDYSSREAYIKIGKQFKANIRLFNMNTERQLAEHLNLVRETKTKGQSKRIPTMVYNIFYKKVREDDEPDLDEGFDEIVQVDFVPRFKSEQDKRLFLQFT